MNKSRALKNKNMKDIDIEQFCQGVTNVLTQIKHRADITDLKARSKKSKKKIA